LPVAVSVRNKFPEGSKDIDQNDLSVLNEHLDSPVRAEELLNMLDYVCYPPIKNIDIIKFK
jgi:hypothetical protein